ncbi:ABC transporter permease [Staphylococcus chromogenes]|nr:ABC transporter permease [Staphylococcus chromogenes]
MRYSWKTLLSSLVLIIAFAWALVPGLFTHSDPLVGSTTALLSPSPSHWFGTDAVGRDLFTRVVYGARESLLGATIAVAVGAVVGTALGVVAGTLGGWVDTVVQRLIDVLLAIPALLLSLAVLIVLGFGTLNAALAVGVTSIAMFARLVRSQVLSVVASDFVEAAYGAGSSRMQVLLRHVVPNSLTPVLALVALQFASALLQLATLGFLGYGAPPPTPEWGLLIADSRAYLATSWWLTILPGAVIVAVVLAANHFSSLLRKEG